MTMADVLARDVMQVVDVAARAGRVRRPARTTGRYRLLVRFASSPAAVKAQVESAQRLLSARVVASLTGEREARDLG